MAKRDKQLAEFFRGIPCVICYQPGELDHILNFKRLAHRDQSGTVGHCADDTIMKKLITV